jgi:restriction endonuclease
VEDLENLRPSEKNKIESGKKHFEALGVDFKVSTQKDLSDLE